MFSNILALLKKPSTYVILAVGGLLVLAVPAVRNLLKPIADKIPGSKSAGV